MTGPAAPDRRALALAIALHGMLLAVLLIQRAAPPRVREEAHALAVFDVAPPPPPPPPEPPPAKAAIRQIARHASAPSGGSPRPPPPLVADLTPEPSAPPSTVSAMVPSPFAADGVPDQLAGQGGDGRGTGQGRGDGDGPGGDGIGYGRAEWIRMPTNDEMVRHWPDRSLRQRIDGTVYLGCAVPKPGPPRRCWVLSEQPQGIGFGRAALAMVPDFRIRPVTRNGLVTDLPVIVPLHFAVKRTASRFSGSRP